MKLKNIVILSVIAMVLISAVQQAYIGYRLGAFRSKTEATLDACFQKAFDRAVDEQVNSLPLPEGTVTHLIYIPVTPGETPPEEVFSFYTSQQTSAILQDVYGVPEVSPDTLLKSLKKELHDDGVAGRVSLRRFDARTGQTLQVFPPDAEPGPVDMEFVSVRAYLHEGKGIAVEGLLHLSPLQRPLAQLFWFSLATRFLSLLVIVAFFVRLRNLRRQQEGIAQQRLEFYRQAKELEAPVRQVKTDMAAGRWTPVHEAGQALLSAVETTLTHAKQANARLNRRRLLRPLLWSGMALSGILLLTVLWGVYFYMEKEQEVAHRSQIAFEEAFMQESRTRYEQQLQHLAAQGKPTSRLTGSTDYVTTQLDSLLDKYWLEHDEMGNPQGPHIHAGYAFVKQGGLYASENARVQRAYSNQYHQGTLGEPYLPLDSLRMDSLFNARLRQEALPEGHLYFFRAGADSLSSRRGYEVTPPVSIRNDRTEWMQGVVPVTLPYVVNNGWHFFLTLLLMLLFTLFCIYIQWRIARRQRRLAQFRRDFTYAMIHDMKSPLQSVLVGSQVMGSGKIAPGSEKARRLCGAMTDECDHLLALSARVVMLTQLERGELRLHPATFCLRPLLDDLAAKFSLKSPKPISFETDCGDGFTVTADPFCLREVLSNLVDNAVKYSRASVRIRFSATRTEDGTRISVRDNGIGISSRDRLRIFGKFERVASGSRSTGASGFGLGLNFVWQVMQAHGGTVEVHSDGHSFSEFSLHLPA